MIEKYFVKYEGFDKETKKRYAKKILRTTELVSELEDDKSGLYLLAQEDKLETPRKDFIVSILKRKKKLNLKKDGEVLIDLESLQGLVKSEKLLQTKKGPIKIGIPCKCGCSFIFFEIQEDEVFINRFIQGDTINLSSRHSSELVIRKDDFGAFLREIQIYLLNNNLITDFTVD